MTSVYLAPSQDVVPQGALVSFILPYATTLELTGRLNGIVLSRTDYNAISRQICICPIIYGKNRVNETLGIEVPTETIQHSYLRPDLANFITTDYGQVQLHRKNDQPFIFPHELTQKVGQKFVDIIRPTAEKLLERGSGFLAYGQIGWAERVPYNQADASARAVILNLTPAGIYRENGMALLVRAYSHIEKYDPRYDIAVGSDKWFETAFFGASKVVVLPIKGTLSAHGGWKPIHVGMSALKGIAKKLEGYFDRAAYEDICSRYNGPVGHLPSSIKSSGNTRQRYHNDRR